MKKVVVVGSAVGVTAVVGAAVAWAAFSGNLTGTLAAGGVATGSGNPCQTQGVDFDFQQPAWDNTMAEYVILGMDYTGVTAACVTAAATLNYAITNGAANLTNSSFTVTDVADSITFLVPIPADSVGDYEVSFLVVG